MEVASACTSSMSVASQVSEDGTTETLGWSVYTNSGLKEGR